MIKNDTLECQSVLGGDCDLTNRICELKNNCSGNGICDSKGMCQCTDPFYGDDCSQKIIPEIEEELNVTVGGDEMVVVKVNETEKS